MMRGIISMLGHLFMRNLSQGQQDLTPEQRQRNSNMRRGFQFIRRIGRF